MGMWQIEMEPIKDWLDGLDKQTAYQVYAALDLLRERGPNLKWNKWYKTAIREAERRYIRWLEEQHGKDTK